MKNAWKDDERLMNDERKEFLRQKENLLIDIQNVQSEMSNKLAVKVSIQNLLKDFFENSIFVFEFFENFVFL